MRRWGSGLVVALLIGVVGIWNAQEQSAAAQAPGAELQVPLVEGPGADPTVTYHDPDGAGSTPGYYLMLYNKDRHNDSILVRKAATLAGLRHAVDQEIYKGSAPGHPAELRCGVGQGGWFVPSGGRWYLYGWGDDCTGLDPNGDLHTKPFVLRSAGSDPLGPYTFVRSWDGPVAAHPWGYANAPVRIDGQLYMTLAYKNQLYIASMSDPVTMSSGWQAIATASASWECTNRCINEGASVVERGGKVFLVFSAGGYESPNYCVGMLTANVAADPLVPSSWTKSDGCVFRRNDAAFVYGPASMNLFTSPDGTETWAAYHVKTSTAQTGIDRVLQARRVEWNADGTPNFGQPHSNGDYVTAPSGEVPAFTGLNTFEAEAGTLSGGATVETSTQASGGSYVASLGASRSATLQLGTYWTRGHRLYMHYTNAGGPAQVNVRVNGGSPTMVSLPPNGDGRPGAASRFGISQYAVVDLHMSAGVNAVGIEGVSGSVNLDKLELDYRMAAEAPALASRGPTNLDAFAARTDGTVWTRTSTDGSTWGAWGQTGTDAVPSGARPHLGAVSRKAEWLDLFAIGRNGTVYTKWWQASGPPGWRNWFSLGAPSPGVGSSGVAAVGRTVNDLEVFVLGADNKVWMKPWHEPGDGGAGWGAWTSLGAPPYGAVAPPAAVVQNPTTTVVFVLGADGMIWYRAGVNGTWGGWSPLASPPGGAVAAPVSASHAQDHFDVVVRGADGALWTRRFIQPFFVGWGPWTQVPGSEGSSYDDRGFALASRRQATTAQLDLIARRPDGQLWWSVRTDTAWQPWTSLSSP